MVLQSKGRKTAQERINERASHNPDIEKALQVVPTGYFYSNVALPTDHGYDVIKNLWRGFAEKHSGQLPIELVPGTPHVSKEVMYEFVRYMALGVAPMLADFPTRDTLKSYIGRFFSIWRRFAFNPILPPLRASILAYFNSPELSKLAPLSRKIREKPIATRIDLEVIIRAAYEHKNIFRTNRMMMQFIAICLISSLSSERPGAIMESDCYRQTNEAMTWGDVQFMIWPNADDPLRPLYGAILGSGYQKGYRGDESKRKWWFLWPEPHGNRAHCALTLLMAFAEEDGVLNYSWKELLCPKVPPPSIYQIPIKEECKKQPLFRAEVLTSKGWVISETAALKARDHRTDLQKVCFQRGFLDRVTDYIFRRLCARNLNRELTAEDRNQQMGQVPNSTMFQQKYQGKLALNDLGGILNGRESSQAITDAMEAASGLSVRLDANAPTKLSIQERAEIWAEPEIVELMRIRDQRQAEAEKAAQELKLLPDDVDRETLEKHKEKYADLRKASTTAGCQCANIFWREYRIRLLKKRVKYFGGAADRHMTGEAPTTLPPLSTQSRPALRPTNGVPHGATPQPAATTSAAGKENENPQTTPSPFLDPVADLINILYHFPEDDVREEILACITVIVGLPERPFVACYPGESPTQDGKCPCCKKSQTALNKRGNTMGEHIHSCIQQDLRNKAQQAADEEIHSSPVYCTWQGCRRKKPFDDRQKFVAHIGYHLDSASECRMLVGEDEVCGEDDWLDWQRHFAQCHDLNICESVQVDYCIICSQWFVDECGDGVEWENHCLDHFSEIGFDFAVRVQDEVDLEPSGVVFVEGCVEFENATGFDGRQPELHGYIARGIAEAPMFCPFCMFNADLEYYMRMKQWTRVAYFEAHLKGHMNDLDGKPSLCPVPACGTKLFTEFELETHLVAYHRMPMCGTTHHFLVRRLRLPPPPGAPAPPVDLTHLTDDVDMDVSASTSKGKERARDVQKRKAHPRETSEYCIICDEWFMYDPLEWDVHCDDHYSEFAAKYETRVEDEVDLEPLGVVFVENCVEYELGSGFDERQPEFHGHGTEVPMFCLFCVYDTDLGVNERMTQFIQDKQIKTHLEEHMHDLDGLSLCPVGSCGKKLFTEYDLGFHIVAFHRLPLYGASNDGAVRRLQLPPPTHDGAPAHQPMDVEDTPAPVSKRKGKKRARTEERKRAYCLGCYRVLVDVEKHLSNARAGSKCRAKLQYYLVDDENDRIGDVVSYTLPAGANADAPSSQGRTGRDHHCTGCDSGHYDIREHFDDPRTTCKKEKFRVRDWSYTNNTFGPDVVYADWLLIAEPLDVQSFGKRSNPRPMASANAPKDFQCEGCVWHFADIAAHFRSLKKTSKDACKTRRFRQRTEDGWGPVIAYATWSENPAAWAHEMAAARASTSAPQASTSRAPSTLQVASTSAPQASTLQAPASTSRAASSSRANSISTSRASTSKR